MNKLLLVVAAAVLFLLTTAGSFFLGTKLERHQFAEELDATQGMLWFNNLLQFRKIESNLAKGCSAAALEATKIAIDKEMELLSEFHKDHGASWLNKYISDRDPNLLDQLGSFQSKYGTVWEEPKCPN